MIEYTHHNDPKDPLYGQTTQRTVPDAPAVTTISGVEFVKRFTAAERAAVLGSADGVVKAFAFELQIAVAGGPVDLTDADTVAGVNYLEQTANLIAVGRAAQILAH